MPYCLCDHIYITQFRDELILLDLRRDQYLTFSGEFSGLLMNLLEGKRSGSDDASKFDSDPHFSIANPDNIQKLIDDKIIEEKNTLFPFHIDQKMTSDGVSNVDWRLPLENKKIRLNLQVLKAIATLLQVNFYIKMRGFYPTIQLIKKSRESQSNYIIPSMEDLRKLANIVNKACLIYPTRTKCLEWAITFVLLALKRKWKCNLEIGVQNYPFMAHAWVECDGKVVIDDQDLRKGLAIILNEPFRKLKI